MTKIMKGFPEISRRKFLASATGITFAVVAGSFVPIPKSKEPEASPAKIKGEGINAWVHLGYDDRIVIFNPAAEMGQGSMTALAMIIAEEMDADWSKVEVQHSPIKPEIYGLQWGGKLGGPMITVGSRTVRGYYKGLRQAGAQARYVLLHTVSQSQGIPMDELTTDTGVVLHKPSGKKWSYGSVAGMDITIEDLPRIPESEWKNPADFRLIGKSIQRVDIPGKVDGSAKFSMDVDLPGMVIALMSRSPVNGSTPSIQNESEIQALPGYIDLVNLQHGVALVFENFEDAFAAKKKLHIEWSMASAAGYDSVQAFDQYKELCVADGEQKVIEKKGNATKALKEADQIVEATYCNDFTYHAQMEPLNAVVSLAPDGGSAEAWIGSQAPDRALNAIADALELDAAQVTLHPCYLGGGFGRRSMADYAEEAALIAKKVQKPVKLIWTREDDLQYGAFRPISVQFLQAALDQKGYPSSWKHITAGTGGGLMTSGVEIPYYKIDNIHLEERNIDEGVRTKHWRSVGHGPNKYAIEAFIDEICLKLDRDPLEYRKYLLRNNPRELQVLNKVVDMCSWDNEPVKGRARGLAFAERSGALAAGVAEISLEDDEIKVHHFWCAVDAGVVVHKDNAHAQLEGGIIFGLSSVLKESVTFVDGAVQESNFHNYHLLRMKDVPDSIDIHIIPSVEAPAGLGEASLPVVGGAVANAFLALTGKPLRHMPFTAERVKEALA